MGLIKAGDKHDKAKIQSTSLLATFGLLGEDDKAASPPDADSMVDKPIPSRMLAVKTVDAEKPSYDNYGSEIQAIKCGRKAGYSDEELCDVVVATTHYSVFAITESEEQPAAGDQPPAEPVLSTWLLWLLLMMMGSCFCCCVIGVCCFARRRQVEKTHNEDRAKEDAAQVES